MNIFVLGVALSLGLLSVWQGGLNRQISDGKGLSMTLLINNSVLIIVAVMIFMAAKLFPAQTPEVFKIKQESSGFSWWYIFPGIMGYMLISGVPYTIGKIGALQAFVFIIAGQMVAGLVWDRWVEGIDLDLPRLASAALAIAAAFVSTLSKE